MAWGLERRSRVSNKHASLKAWVSSDRSSNLARGKDRKEGKPSSQWAVSIIQSPGFAKDSPIQGVCSKASTETRFEDSYVLYESNRTSCVKHMRWLAGQFHHSSWQGGKDIWSYFTIEVFFLLFFTGNPYFINQTDNGKRLSVFYSTRLYWASTGSGHTCQLTFIVDYLF